MWSTLFLLAGLAQLIYWSLLLVGLRRAQNPPAHNAVELPPLTVIVAARNEEHSLPNLLEALQEQTHAEFQVVVVDDVSDDQTASIVAGFEEIDERFTLIQLDANKPPRKKRALTRGIAEAKYELLALTDADCEPPPTWLAELSRKHTQLSEPTILTGYSPYRQLSTLQEKLASFETFVTGILTTATATLKKPYMAVGRNISYPRSIFYKLGGFEHGMKSLSGDDDLFIQEAHRQQIPVEPIASPGSFVWTDAPSSWTSWLRQKRRHASAGRFYRREMQFHLTAFHASDLICWLAPLFFGWAGAAILGAKLLIQAVTLTLGARLLHEQRLLPWSPVLAPIYAIYITIVEPFGVAFLPDKWE